MDERSVKGYERYDYMRVEKECCGVKTHVLHFGSGSPCVCEAADGRDGRSAARCLDEESSVQ
jgi:hypothetical protein